MPLKTEAQCTVLSEEQFNIANIGFRGEVATGGTVYLPNDVAKHLADLGAVTIVTLGS